MTSRGGYTLLGVLAGLCVPLCAWALRFPEHHGDWSMEWERYRFFYEYMGAAAAASLGLSGRLLGAQFDALQDERCACRSTRQILNKLALIGLKKAGLHRAAVSLDSHLEKNTTPSGAWPDRTGARSRSPAARARSVRDQDHGGPALPAHRGDVYPSGFLPVRAGNVREQSLGSIYRDSPIFRSLRDASQLKGRCGLCEFKELCGGSRARAYAVTGDMLSEDPLCAYVPRQFSAPFMENRR